jgi:ferric enterobactin receptor
MKQLFFFLFTVLTAFTVNAQFPGMPGGANAKAIPNMGHVFGKIVDTAGKPIADVSVVLLQNKYDSVAKKKKDVLLKAFITKANGEFNFEELPMFGMLKMKITATGYVALDQTISFMPKMDPTAAKPAGGPSAGGDMSAMMGGLSLAEKDLGKIKLQSDAKELAGVTVKSTTPLMRLDIDKKVFNVEKNIVSAGGTALDVMRNVPSVNVDIDGNVSIRNSSPTIFIDGRPTTLTLEQIPADAIESVEVITNPSAKYDASGGGAGILNIVLKKNRKTGYNGNVRVGVDKWGAMNGGGDFSVRQGKLNLSASMMFNQNRGRTYGTTDRVNLLDIPETSVTQDNFNKTRGGFMFGKLGLDYFISNKTTLSLSGIRVHGEFDPNEIIDITSDSLFNSGKISTYSERLTTGHRQFDGKGLVFGMKQLFTKTGEELTADINYFGGKNLNNSLYTTNYLTTTHGNIVGTDLQKVLGDGSDKNFTFQTDYTKPFAKNSKLETGARVAIRSRTNNQYNYIFDKTADDYVLVPSATSNYKNTDNVYAAYATVSSSIKDFGYKLGLRAESSNYDGTLTNTGVKFSNNYPISLFPSVFLSQKLKNKQELQVSYTRRINRPNFFQTIPFIDYTDRLNITKGNPNLVPEFTQSYEMSYLKTFKGNNTFLASVYYRHKTNLITRYLNQETDPLTGSDILVNTYINANSSYAAGAELTSTNYLTKWWDISTNVNIYNSKINTDNINGTSQDALWSWFGKFNSNFKLPAKFTMQLTTIYQSKSNLPANTGGGGMGGPPGFGQAQSASQGYIKAYWGMDIAIKKTFLKNDVASVSLSVNDIFKTRYTNQFSQSEYFIQNYNRIRDPQMFRLNFSYRFGKMDVNLFKRKNMNSSGTQDAMQGMQ